MGLSEAVRYAAAVATLSLSAGCADPVRPDPAVFVAADGHSRTEVVLHAFSVLGAPYRYGGSGPQVFDCSGLVQYSYARAGIDVPRTAAAQYAASQPVPLTELRPGDLLFFHIDERKPEHVAIYLGDGRFVHAPSSGKTVSKASLDEPFWDEHFYRSGSFFR